MTTEPSHQQPTASPTREEHLAATATRPPRRPLLVHWVDEHGSVVRLLASSGERPDDTR